MADFGFRCGRACGDGTRIGKSKPHIAFRRSVGRRTAQAAGLTVWGTLKVLLEAKSQGLTESIAPLLDRLNDAGMWLSEAIRQRVLVLANETQNEEN